jgi:hypothetical protein
MQICMEYHTSHLSAITPRYGYTNWEYIAYHRAAKHHISQIDTQRKHSPKFPSRHEFPPKSKQSCTPSSASQIPLLPTQPSQHSITTLLKASTPPLINNPPISQSITHQHALPAPSTARSPASAAHTAQPSAPSPPTPGWALKAPAASTIPNGRSCPACLSPPRSKLRTATAEPPYPAPRACPTTCCGQ